MSDKSPPASYTIAVGFIYLLLSALVASPAPAGTDPLLDPFILFCQKKNAEGLERLKQFIQDNPKHGFAILLRENHSPGSRSELAQKIKTQIPEGKIPESEIDRLIFVNGLLVLEDRQFDIMERLLSFKADSSTNEALRLSLLSNVQALRGDPMGSLENLDRAMDLLDYPDSSLLSHLFFSDPLDLEQQKIVRKHLGKISELEERDPYKPYVQALFGLWERSKSDEEILALYKKAYQMCPTDLGIALDLARHQLGLTLHREAFVVLKQIERDHLFYPAEVDALLANAASWLGELEEAEKYLERTYDVGPYLSQNAHDGLSELEEWLKKERAWQKKRKLYLGGGVLVGFLLIGGLVYFLRRKRKTPVLKDEKIAFDQDALRKADDKTKDAYYEAEQPERVVLQKYSSTNGYNEEMLLEMIMYLGSHGIDASYESTVVGIEGGAITSFLLKVPPAKKEEAARLMEERKKKLDSPAEP